MKSLFFLIFITVSVFATDYEDLNLTAEQWNYQLATVANNLGFTMTFLICFLAVLVMRK
jgi:hypothetical protein